MRGAAQSFSGLCNIIIRRNALRLLSPYGVRLTRVFVVRFTVKKEVFSDALAHW
jgi:hypothetical protein